VRVAIQQQIPRHGRRRQRRRLVLLENTDRIWQNDNSKRVATAAIVT